MKRLLLDIAPAVNDRVAFSYPAGKDRVKYAVYDFAGHVHLAGQLAATEDHFIVIDTLPAGTYTLRIIEGDICCEGKFVKNK